MLTRLLLPVLRRSNNAIRYQALRCYGGGGEHKSHRELAIENNLTLDHLPTPEGSWLEHYQQRQKNYNMQLVASAVLMAVTLYIAGQTGALFLNPGPDYKKIVVDWDKPDIAPVEVEE